MPKCKCGRTTQKGTLCRDCRRDEYWGQGLPGHELAGDGGLAIDDLELARDDYEYQARHAEDESEARFYRRQADPDLRRHVRRAGRLPLEEARHDRRPSTPRERPQPDAGPEVDA